MNRRKFINKTGVFLAAASVPTILPTGTLFAKTATPVVKHVVFCLFAGGIRTWESINFKDGNLMPNTLRSDAKISEDIAGGIDPMPIVLSKPLQENGTLFKGFRYKSTFTHHFPAQASAVSGKYYFTNEIYQPIRHPSIFEYFKKHSPFGNKGLNTWWVANKPGDYPYIQYSKHHMYGEQYAANMIQPSTLFKFDFREEMHPTKESHLNAMMDIIKNSKKKDEISNSFQPLNTDRDRELLKQFVAQTHQRHFKDNIKLWSDLDNSLINQDLINVFTACEVLKEFKPNLLVVNMQESDIGHYNFTGYCNNMKKADYALAKLWQTIQSDPVLKDNTILIAQPEFGRNANHNTVNDAFGRFAMDHNGDDVSQQMFCLIAGPPNVVHQNKVMKEQYGEAIDTAPTIAHLMGFKEMIPKDLLTGKVLHEAFV